MPQLSFVHPDRKAVDLPTYLERITILLSQAVNARDRTLLKEVTDRYFTANLQVERSSDSGTSLLHSTTREAYVDNMISYVAKYDFHIKPYNTSALIDEDAGKGLVFTTVATKGTDYASPALTRENVIVYYFQRSEDDEWLCYRFEFMRGPGRFWFDAVYCDGEKT